MSKTLKYAIFPHFLCKSTESIRKRQSKTIKYRSDGKTNDTSYPSSQ